MTKTEQNRVLAWRLKVVVRNNYLLTLRRLRDADYAPAGIAAREYS